MKKKFVLIATLAAALCFTAPMVSEAAESGGTWKANANGWWYELEDGSYLTSGFHEIADANSTRTFYFDANGYMATGWKYMDNNWYYFGNDGAMRTGWQAIGNTWYYFGEDGVMFSNGVYASVDNADICYLFDASGAMRTGWAYVNGNWYYCNASGIVQTGWQYYNGSWYYLEAEHVYGQEPFGAMYWADGYEINDVTYWFNAGGQMITGWYYAGDNFQNYGGWVYCNADGSAYDGWLYDGGRWYYINNGTMQAGGVAARTYDENGKISHYGYLLGRDGAMVTGWYYQDFVDEFGQATYNWRYSDPTSGAIVTEWIYSGNKWYFIDTNGYMKRGTIIRGPQPSSADYDKYEDYEAALDKWYASGYLLGTDGAMVTGGWYSMSTTAGTTWYYTNADGSIYDGWLLDGGKWYFIDNGVMQTNLWIDGAYFIGPDGVWTPRA